MALKISLLSELSFLCKGKQSIIRSQPHPHGSPVEQGYQGTPALQQTAACPAHAGIETNRWILKETFSCVS